TPCREMARCIWPSLLAAKPIKPPKRLKENGFASPGTLPVSQPSHAHLLYQSVRKTIRTTTVEV
ncbi:hypothetical protein, partial [Pseudomonas sp. CM25]|uniref:hypothetical protein n=1 Tax=Pseudomonas sp. CM25 TaxID=2738448 RepID=UPI001C4992B0